jgi:hypothetical protein
VLVEDEPARGLGRALAWADARGLSALHLVVDADGGLPARRAALFDRSPTVWTVDGRVLRPAVPSPRPVPPPVPASARGLGEVIAASGAEVVEEQGVLAGEVIGLEVCRAVEEDGAARLDVGIGAHDREAFRLVHGDQPVDAALAELVEQVAAHRRLGAPPHALNRIARERQLRWRLCREPELIGLRALAPAPPPVPRLNLKDPVPCAAVGTDERGAPVVVVCSAGVDLDAVPFAADARDALGPDDSLVIAVPEGDDHPVTRALAARLVPPADVVAVPAATASP